MNAQTLRAILALSCERKPGNKTCSDHDKCFFGLSKELRENGNLPMANAAALLGGICSMMFNDARTGNPWGPVLADYKAGRRSLEADDLEKDHLDALGELVPEIDDPELRARIADVLWTRGHGYQFGQMAIAAYNEDGNRPEASNHVSERISRLGRAANIARRLGRTKLLHVSAFDQLDRLLDELTDDPENAPLLPHLLDIIFDHQLGDPERHLSICETLAGQASLRKEWDLAARFWELASSWHHKQGRENEARRCRQTAAWETIARGRDPDGRMRYGAGYSAGWILRGLTALKSSGGDRAEIEALSSKLAELQGEAQADLHTFGINPKDSMGEYDDEHSKHIERLESHFSGKMLQDAIFLYCNITNPTDVGDLKATIMERGAGLITQMIGMVATDNEGKETDRAEGIGWNGEVAESDILKRLYEHARTISWPLTCDWFLDPGRRIIAKKHAPRIKDLVFLISNNPFVPPGHERIFLRGIHAGFEGDFLLATHLLVPQFESSLRRYLKQCGVVTWILKDGLQKELDLGGLLSLPRTTELLGEDLVFDLRGILTEKFGVNLRNDMAHGNMAEAEFFRGFGPLYFWWLLLRMVWIAYEARAEVNPDVSSVS
jgi:hypothetical protein